MFETCTKDSDCVDNQVCFIANQSWSNQTMCYCNTYYGFSGPDCSITLTEPNSIFLVVIGTICIVVCAVFLVISAGNLLLLWRAIPKDRRKKTVLTDSVLATTVYLTFGALLLIPYGSLLIVVALRPFDPTVSDDESLMYLEFIAQNCLTIAMMFLASGVMTIALGFVEMTMNLAPAKRKAVQVFGAVYKLAFFITVVSLVAVRKVYLAFIASFPFVIILAGAYIAGLMLLTRKIKKHREQNDKALESLRSVQKTVLLLCLCLVAEIALSAVFSFTSLLTGWRVLSPPGHLTVSLLGHLTWFPSVLGCLAVLRDITTWRMVRERQYARAMGATTSTPSIDRRGIGFGLSLIHI